MKNVHLLAVSAVLATLAITGCTSKPTKTSTTPTAAVGDGTNTAGIGTDGSLNGQALSPEEAARRALLGRVVHFELDSSDIAQNDFAVLNAHAKYLSSSAGAHVTLTGHTDERGTREYNLALGERRAKSVQTYLVTNGVQAGQIEVVSYGKEKPVNEGHNEAAWAENRRVEIGYDKQDPSK